MYKGSNLLRRWSGALAQWLALLAIALHLIIPPGFMPAHADGAQGFEMVICTSTGTRTVWLNHAGDPIEKPVGDVSHELCAFAAAASPLVLATTSILVTPNPSPAVGEEIEPDRRVLSTRVIQHGPRGPPPAPRKLI